MTPSPIMPRSLRKIARRHEPVADVIGEQPLLSRAPDLLLELRVPPHVVDVASDADPVAKLVADVERLLERVDARALGGLHGMQRLDRERHPRFPRLRKNHGDAIAHLLAGAAQILGARGQPADDEDQTSRAELVRLLDRAPVVVAPVLGGEKAARQSPSR